MRVNLPNLSYAFAHPIRTQRYLRHRDTMAYSDIGRFIPADPVVVEARLTTGRTPSKWQSSGRSRPSTRLNRFHLPLLQLLTLEGAADVLKSVSAIHMEVSNVRLYEGAPPYSEVRARMADWGFVPTIEAFFRVSGNVLFVRRRAN